MKYDVTQKDVDTIVQTLIPPNTKTITFAEFIRIFARTTSPRTPAEQLTLAFGAFDLDNSGYFDVNALQNAVRELREDVPEDARDEYHNPMLTDEDLQEV